MERWPRRRSGAGRLTGFDGARAGRPQAPRPRQRKAAGGLDRRPPGPEPGRLNTLGARTVKPDGIAPRDKQAQAYHGDRAAKVVWLFLLTHDL